MRTLRRQVLTVQVLLIALLAIGNYYICRPQHSPVELLQADSDLRSANLLKRVIQNGAEHLSAHTTDYSLWDEMVDAVRLRDTAWCRSYLPMGVQTYGLDAGWLCDTNFAVLFSTTVDTTASDLLLPVPVRDRAALLQESHFCHYFWQDSDRIVEVAIAPVHPVTDEQRTSPPRGYYVAARLWNDDVTDQLSLYSEAEVSIAAVNDLAATWASEPQYGILRFADSLRDWQNHPVALVRGEAFSRSLKQLYTTAAVRFWGLAGLALALTAIYWACLRFWLMPEKRELLDTREATKPDPVHERR